MVIVNRCVYILMIFYNWLMYSLIHDNNDGKFNRRYCCLCFCCVFLSVVLFLSYAVLAQVNFVCDCNRYAFFAISVWLRVSTSFIRDTIAPGAVVHDSGVNNKIRLPVCGNTKCNNEFATVEARPVISHFILLLMIAVVTFWRCKWILCMTYFYIVCFCCDWCRCRTLFLLRCWLIFKLMIMMAAVADLDFDRFGFVIMLYLHFKEHVFLIV